MNDTKKFCSNNKTGIINDQDKQQNNDISLINLMLYDDCLINIITLLPLRDRIKIERVCQRWQNLSKLSWSSFNKLDFRYLKTKTKFLCQDTLFELDEVKILYKLLSRCAKYLRYVDMSYAEMLDETDLSKILNYLAIRSSNIVDLILSGERLNYPDIYFGFLFQSNKNLKSVQILNSKLDCTCFLSLNHENLETFILKDNTYDFSNLPDLTINFKNLKVLKIIDYDYSSQTSFNPNYEKFFFIIPKITEFVCISNIEKYIDISKILSEAKNLKSLVLSTATIEKDLLTSLPIESLDKLVFMECSISSNTLIGCLKRLKKATALGLSNLPFPEILTDSIISYCSNLKFLELSNHWDASFFSTSSIKLNKLLNKLDKLEILDLTYTNVNDNCLELIASKCQLLKNVCLFDCNKITDAGIYFIGSLPLLEILNIECSDNLTGSSINFMQNIKELSCGNGNYRSKDFENLLKNSPHLEMLDLSMCKNKIYKGVVDIALNTKNIRRNTLKLVFRSLDELQTNFDDINLLGGIEIIDMDCYAHNLLYSFY